MTGTAPIPKFNAEEQFKQSLLEVLASNDDRLFSLASKVEGPGAAYLK